MISQRRTGSVLLGWALAISAGRLAAQDANATVEVKAAEAVEVQVTPAAPPGANPAPPGAVRVPGQPGGKPPGPPGAPGQPGQPGQPGAQPGPGGEGQKPDAGPKAKQRPTTPPTPPNPEELKIQPDETGRVRFNFQGQPWEGVLNWLARISGQSLDWQELPSDFLNLRTQKSYTVDEARDLINRHLLDRGYTLLRDGEVLHLVNIKKLDPSLVPRVRPDDLDERDPHEFVKVSLPLDWLLAETAVEELQPMLSPNGKLKPLRNTNRLEAMDAVVNLREIRDVLLAEQSSRGRKRLVRVFRLEHVRASDVREHLKGLLGLDQPPAGAAPGQGTPEQQAMQQQMMMAMQARRGGGGGEQGQQPAPAKPAPAVHIVVNQKENSVLVNAPADQMAIVAEAVAILDIPSDKGQSLLRNMNRMQVYRLAAVDPETLVKMLLEGGSLDPTTTLTVDKRNRAIIADASLADHVIIRQLVSKLDGSDRSFEVIKLRRLEADYVAGTIEFMMAGGEKKKQQNRFNPYMFEYYMFGGGGRGNEQEDESKKFRVDADVEHNRLLLWANEVEMQEVENLLVKLGEIPAAGGNPSTIRVLDTISPEEADELLRRLQRAWPGISPNKLKLAPGAEPAPHEPEPAAEHVPPAKKRAAAQPSSKPAPARKAKVPEAAREKRRPSVAAASPHSSDRRTLLDTKGRSAGLMRLVQLDEREGKATEEDDGEDRGSKIDDRKDEGERERDATAAERDKRPAKVEEAAEEGDAAIEDRKADAGEKEAAADDDQAGDDGAVREDQVAEPRVPAGPPRRQPKERTAAAPAPIHIGRGPDGRLVISSDDTEALDRFEDLVSQIAPPRRDYKIFKMKYSTTWAYGVALNLKDFFEEKDKEEDQRRRRWFWPGNQQDDTRRLSKRRPLKFISDSDSNTILVTGADPQQLKTIEELIKVYDVPESSESKAVRQTKIFPIRHSKARVIGDALKEVYRDLLSANDPALQNNNQNGQKNQRPPEPTYTYVYNYGGDDKKPETPMKFKGLLSIGVDELSNTLVVSSVEGLMENIAETIKSLDEAAKPAVNRMQVIRVGRGIDTGHLSERLSKLAKQQPPPQQPGQPRQPQQPQAPNGGQPNGQSTMVIENGGF